MDLTTGQSPMNDLNQVDKVGMLTARTEQPNLALVPNDRRAPFTSKADDKENNVTA